MDDQATKTTVTMDDLFTLADRFKTLREERDALKNQLTDANKALDDAEHKLTDAMAEAECPNFSRSGKLFIMTTTPRWSAEKERRQELYDTLRRGGYEQRIHTLSAEGEFLLTLLASYAQEESYSVSENCKWRIRKDFKEGRPTFTRLLGYELVDGKFIVVPGEAELVRQIFADYLSGMGVLAIRKKLLAEGVGISQTGLSKLLRNEKYAGDLLLQIFCSVMIKFQASKKAVGTQYYWTITALFVSLEL